MQSGQVCRAYALRDEYFCYFHSRLHRAAKQPVSLIDSFDIPLLEDRCAVQLTVTRVLRALVNKTIDRHSASTLLYGLQLALQSVDRSSSWAIGFDTVESLSQTPDGDEIALGPDEDPEDDEDEEEEEDEEEKENEEEEEKEEEEEEEEEAPSDAASNSHPENVDDEEDENESTEQLIATLNQLQSVNRALEAGDMRPAARLLRLGG
jgi:hypothetical protein